jgi:hypothetical protein
MNWMGLDLDQYPPNLVGCGWIWINIHFHPFPSTYLEVPKTFPRWFGGVYALASGC